MAFWDDAVDWAGDAWNTVTGGVDDTFSGETVKDPNRDNFYLGGDPNAAGNPPMASPPADSSSHIASGLSTPPGYRQPIPTITTGSAADTGVTRDSAVINCWVPIN